MSKSKLSKRQIAGALLLSSTVIGATASGTTSANFMDFMKNTIGNVAGKVGNFVSDHAWSIAIVGFSASLMWDPLSSLANDVYEKARDIINTFSARKKFSEKIKEFIKVIIGKMNNEKLLYKDLGELEYYLTKTNKQKDVKKQIFDFHGNFLKKYTENEIGNSLIYSILTKINKWEENLKIKDENERLIRKYENKRLLGDISDFMKMIEEDLQDKKQLFSNLSKLEVSVSSADINYTTYMDLVSYSYEYSLHKDDTMKKYYYAMNKAYKLYYGAYGKSNCNLYEMPNEKFFKNIDNFIKTINKKLEKNTKLKDELEALKDNLSNKSEDYEIKSVTVGADILEKSFNFLKKIKEIDKNYGEIETKLSDNINNFIKNLSSDIITIDKNKYLLIDDFINKIAQKSQEEIKSFSNKIVGFNSGGLEDRKEKLSENISNFSEEIDSFINEIGEECEESKNFRKHLLTIQSNLRSSPGDTSDLKNNASNLEKYYENLKYKDKIIEKCYTETLDSLIGIKSPI